MPVSEFKVEFRFKWWLHLYLRGVILFALATHQRPDEKKLVYWISKGLKQRVVPRERATRE